MYPVANKVDSIRKWAYVSENDVMWAKRITREIVLNDPGNVSLMFPRLVKYTSHSGSLGSQAAYNEVLTGIDARKNLFSILYTIQNLLTTP